MNPSSEQKRLYALLTAQKPCFVRICDDDDALWVSDLPRRMDCGEVMEKLLEEGFRAWMNHSLLFVDWAEERWNAYLSSLPMTIPDMPAETQWHEVYALCRLLMLRPAKCTDAQMPMLRCAVKLAQKQPVGMRKAMREMQEAAAVQIRNHQPVCYDAGRVLANWLNEQTCV